MSPIPSTFHDLITPALLLDWPTAERNINRASQFVQDKTVRLRPHFKNHKRVSLAKRQLDAGGCVGITAATVVEARSLVDGGVEDVLIANQVTGLPEISLFAELAGRARVRVAVDNLENVKAIAGAARDRSIDIGVLIEVDIGMGRCGVAPGDAAVRLAEEIAALDGIHFEGIQAYEGHAIGIMDRNERESVAIASMEKALETKSLLENAGHICVDLSGAGTGTFRATGALQGVSELQIGSYVTMDWCYKEKMGDQFEIALTVLARVVSSGEDKFVLNSGVKSIGHEFGPPRLRDYPEAEIPRFGAEEHVVVKLKNHGLKVGDLAHVVPSHCCTTCALHRDMFVCDGDRVLEVWPDDVGHRSDIM